MLGVIHLNYAIRGKFRNKIACQDLIIWVNIVYENKRTERETNRINDNHKRVLKPSSSFKVTYLEYKK